MKLEDFIRTKYDLKEESAIGGVSIILDRVGSDSTTVILPEFIQHFYDMGERGYLIGRAMQLYEETKSMKEWIK
jgi:hypothetical protein